MKNYRIYILALLLVMTSQYLLAIDGWWEKVETKNKPIDRITPSMDWFTNNKVIMHGGFGYAQEGKDSLDQTEFWIFDYNQRDWIKSQITLPFPYNKFAKFRYIKGSMVNLSEGTMAFCFQEKATPYALTDSSLWILNVDQEKWERIQQKSTGPAVNDNKKFVDFYKIQDSVIFGSSSYGYTYNHTTKDWIQAPEGCNSSKDDCATLGNGKLLKVSKVEEFYPYEPSVPIEQQNFKYKFYNYENREWIPLLKGNELKFKYINSYQLQKNSINIGKGKVMFLYTANEYSPGFFEYLKDSHLFDYNQLDNPVSIMNIDTIGPDANHQGFSICKLSKDKILFYGGGIRPVTSSLPPTIPHQTWVFHIDPSLTDVEYVEINKKERTKKIVISNSFEIETLNETLKNHTLTDLLGNSITNFQIESGLISTKVSLNLPNGTYMFQFELNNREKYTYLLLVNNN